MSPNRTDDEKGPCDHSESPNRTPTCEHLAGPLTWGVKYYQWMTGHGLDKVLVCGECLERLEAGTQITPTSICDDCLDVLEHDLGDLEGVRGTPEIKVDWRSMDESLMLTQLPFGADEIVDLAPIEREAAAWLLLLTDGSMHRVHVETGEVTRVCTIHLPPEEPDHEPWNGHVLRVSLHVSPDGAFAAVVHDYGKMGRVYELRTGTATMELHCGNYHPETVPFSFAFVERRGRTVAIHRTDWHRLEASDAATGDLLTARASTVWRRGEPRPEHFADYFHGRLMVSPDGRKVLDDGWVWHPVGVPKFWDIDVWLDSNVWESEDGMGRITLTARDDYWDHGLCWIDSDRIAVGGIGDRDWVMLDGVRCFSTEVMPSYWIDVRNARELDAFAGPSGIFFSDGERLFSSCTDGLSVWDVEGKALTARIEGFIPSKQHIRDRELVQLSGSTLSRWRY